MRVMFSVVVVDEDRFPGGEVYSKILELSGAPANGDRVIPMSIDHDVPVQILQVKNVTWNASSDRTWDVEAELHFVDSTEIVAHVPEGLRKDGYWKRGSRYTPEAE